MTKYIKNKKVKKNKENNVLDLNGIDEAAWNFISIFYNSEWDLLIADENNCSFRQKVAAQFTPRLSEIKTNNKSKKKIDKPTSFVKLPSLIPAKISKEVNEISKFFKKDNQLIKKKDTKESYVQVSSSTTNMRAVLKIKEMFPNLQAKEIENIKKSSMAKISLSKESI